MGIDAIANSRWLTMRLSLLIPTAAIVFLGCAVPPPTARQPAPDLAEARHAGVSFRYRTDDFAEVVIGKEPKQTAQDIGDGIQIGVAPEHACFKLRDRRPLPALEEGPRYFHPTYSFVCAIPLEDSSVDDFGRAYPELHDAAATLRQMLRERPRQPARRADLPDMPTVSAGHSILSRFAYLDFRSGSGILFLTQYTQEMEPNPANNEELVLDFQGITRDGRYYVAARLAVTHPSLPRGIDFTDHIERDREYRYLRKAEEDLEGFAEESFQPSLTRLKLLLSSIAIEG